ncbi:MAG: hypothetical protein M3P22_00920 [bacterium]|nr:hypothetical protein [bacterium]
MKKIIFIFGIILISLLFSCGPSKDLVEAEKKEAANAKELANFKPITSDLFETLIALDKRGFLPNISVKTDSLSFGGRKLPDDIIIKPDGSITLKEGGKDFFVAKNMATTKIKVINQKERTITVSFKDYSGSTRDIIFKEDGENFVFFSTKGGDTVVINTLIYPESYGKNSSKLYVSLNEEKGDDGKKVLTGERFTPITPKKK